MRKYFGLLPVLALAACGGGGGAGPQTVGSIAGPPAPAGASNPGAGGTGGGVTTGGSTTGGTTTGGTTGGTTTGGTTTGGTTTGGTSTGNAGTGGSGAGVTAGNGGTTTPIPTSFLTANAAKTYDVQGGASSLKQQTSATLYQGNASTAKSPLGTIDYDPRDNVFTLKVADTKSGVTTNLRYQDPLHQIAFGGARSPQSGVPNLDGFSYLESIGSAVTDRSTFFYQRPGGATVYVTLAGYVRNSVPTDPAAEQLLERGAFVFGDQTILAQVPATGTASFSGGFLATMINNPTRDTLTQLPTFYQWISGSSSMAVNFGAQTFTLALAGQVDSAGANNVMFATGTNFFANGSGTIDLLRTGGFSGTFQNACFNAACGTAGSVAVAFNGVTPGSATTGTSSIDGAFYGPGAVNVGGSFRVIGGVPDQRVDINGAFTGAKVGN